MTYESLQSRLSFHFTHYGRESVAKLQLHVQLDTASRHKCYYLTNVNAEVGTPHSTRPGLHYRDGRMLLLRFTWFYSVSLRTLWGGTSNWSHPLVTMPAPFRQWLLLFRVLRLFGFLRPVSLHSNIAYHYHFLTDPIYLPF
jgi:hypothetical protein